MSRLIALALALAAPAAAFADEAKEAIRSKDECEQIFKNDKDNGLKCRSCVRDAGHHYERNATAEDRCHRDDHRKAETPAEGGKKDG